jgi:hypothetical protein
LRLCFGKQQLIVRRINYAVKGGGTGYTLQIVTFKSTFIDVRSDSSTEFEFHVAFGARNNLRAVDQRDFARWKTGHGTHSDHNSYPIVQSFQWNWTPVFVQIVKHHRLVVEPKMPADRAMERCVKIMLLEVTSRILTWLTLAQNRRCSERQRGGRHRMSKKTKLVRKTAKKAKKAAKKARKEDEKVDTSSVPLKSPFST